MTRLFLCDLARYTGDVLLFVKKKYAVVIARGEKTFELRVGDRYRNVKPGDSLSINGHFRVTVSEALHLDSIAEVVRETSAYLSESDIRECYGNTTGPFYLFRFSHQAKQSSLF